MWGCFSGNNLGPIVFINETVNMDIYIAILHENLLPHIDAIIADSTSHLVFQQDNATCHVSKRTQEWLANSGREHGFLLMQWLPNSPNLNPIEHL
jgi:2C-methyl-D-erythritol 2,4-cyclodiphosphate synthase